AISRLRSYTPPSTNYFSLPLTRRAAVLILLYADRQGDLRVVLTMRAKTLSSYAGQAALPGGKADTLLETPFQTARREAYEEIGLPLSDTRLPPPFRIHHLCELPTSFARTELGVRPCIAFIDPSSQQSTSSSRRTTRSSTQIDTLPSAEDVLIPRLDAKEVAAVFTAPFESFLSTTLSTPSSAHAAPERSAWYGGQWIEWHGDRWRMHNFYVPSSDQPVAWAESPATTMTMNRFRVFGMTARILVDAARIAYGREPEFEHNTHLGDEDMIGRLLRENKLGEREKK
ncbi:hypothetical protein BT63DRAFT_361155, partial [Microthyrium microscopicum]